MRTTAKAGLVGCSAAAVALGLAGTASSDTTPAEPIPSPTLASPDSYRPTAVQEIHFAVAREVPGFGGFWVNPEEPDRLKVWLKDPDAQLEPTRASLARLVGDYPALDLSRVDALQGRYGFLELQDWHERLLAAIANMPGWISLDTQEMTNTLWVGVEDEATRGDIEVLLSDLGIPSGAVEFRLEQRVAQRSCSDPPDELTDCRRPLLGGFQIQGETVGGMPIGGCTMGFLAKRGGVQGFVTASHCTEVKFYVDAWPVSSEFHQPTIEDRIGMEQIDPAPFAGIGGVCPVGNRCRWSDAAWIATDPGIQANQGWIAKSDFASPHWRGGLLRVNWELGSYVGMEVFKVGRTTGLTQGFVTQTNVDLDAPTVHFPTALLLDQHRTNLYADEGDSGSAVFTFRVPFNALDIYLVGILWGNDDPPSSSSVYSDVQYAQWQSDLGELEVNPPPSGGGGR
jgi:hypothetical protein